MFYQQTSVNFRKINFKSLRTLKLLQSQIIFSPSTSCTTRLAQITPQITILIQSRKQVSMTKSSRLRLTKNLSSLLTDGEDFLVSNLAQHSCSLFAINFLLRQFSVHWPWSIFRKFQRGTNFCNWNKKVFRFLNAWNFVSRLIDVRERVLRGEFQNFKVNRLRSCCRGTDVAYVCSSNCRCSSRRKFHNLKLPLSE